MIRLTRRLLKVKMTMNHENERLFLNIYRITEVMYSINIQELSHLL